MLQKPNDPTRPGTVQVTVTRGRSLFLDGRTYGPGEEVAIPAADYQHSVTGGWIIRSKRHLAAAHPPGPAGWSPPQSGQHWLATNDGMGARVNRRHAREPASPPRHGRNGWRATHRPSPFLDGAGGDDPRLGCTWFVAVTPIAYSYPKRNTVVDDPKPYKAAIRGHPAGSGKESIDPPKCRRSEQTFW
jgi:hypothetical protein